MAERLGAELGSANGKSSRLAAIFICGAGRTRTAVQTPHQTAFYTLILPLIVGVEVPEDGLDAPLAFGAWRSLKASLRAACLDDTP